MQKQNDGPIRVLEASLQHMYSETIDIIHKAGADSVGNRALSISHALIRCARLVGRRSIQQTREALNMVAPRKEHWIQEYSLSDQKMNCAPAEHSAVGSHHTAGLIGISRLPLRPRCCPAANVAPVAGHVASFAPGRSILPFLASDATSAASCAPRCRIAIEQGQCKDARQRGGPVNGAHSPCKIASLLFK